MKLLMHTCCGPCLVGVDTWLKDKEIEYEALFYNPNIHPYLEYDRRRKTLTKLADVKSIQVHYVDSFMQHEWEQKKDLCAFCYEKRIEKTAQTAKEKGFTHFSTTLLISPYQQHEMIKTIAQKAQEKYGVSFYYQDFRKIFRKGQEEARKLELYRQKYCGCIHSYDRSEFKEKIKW